MLQSVRLIIGLGLLAGSCAITSAAHADIPITGGDAKGNAAFFSPSGTGTTPAGSPVLFDATVRNLRLVTPNGTATNARFVPNASSFKDVNGNSIPDSGDTGKLQGTLSGVAFSAAGSPVFFQNIATNLSFTLNSFNPSVLQGGTLISPKQEGSASLVFLPVTSVTLSSSSSTNFTATEGSLSVGSFEATLTGDFIGLPANLTLRPISDNSNTIVTETARRVKFEFKGDDVIPGANTDLSLADNTIAYRGPTTDFKVQSVGTSGRKEFKFEGKTGQLDFELVGSSLDIKREGVVSNTARTDYEIKGEASGIAAFDERSALFFTGESRKDIDVKFEQANGKLDGKARGDVAFNIQAGGVSYTDFNPVVVTPVVTPVSSVSNTVFINTTIITSTTVFSPTVTIVRAFYPSALVRESDFSNVTYSVYQPERTVEVVVERGRGDDDDDDDDDDDRIVVVEREKIRGRSVKKRGRVISAYKVVGLPSRVFPGLTGLRQIPAEQVQDSTPTPSTETTTPTTSTPSTTESSTTTQSTTGTTISTTTQPTGGDDAGDDD